MQLHWEKVALRIFPALAVLFLKNGICGSLPWGTYRELDFSGSGIDYCALRVPNAASNENDCKHSRRNSQLRACHPGMWFL